MDPQTNGSKGVRFDASVNLGHILIMVGIALSGAASYAAARVTINEHAMRIASTEAQQKAQWSQLESVRNSIWAIQADVAVIKDRISRTEKK